MNRQRRKHIDSIIELLEQAKVQLEEVYEAEEDYFDNMPESFQYGENGDTAQEAMDNLQAAIDSLEDAIFSASEAKGE